MSGRCNVCFKLCPGGRVCASSQHGAWTFKLLNRRNNNIQCSFERVLRLYNWLLDWPTTKLGMSLRYSTLPGSQYIFWRLVKFLCMIIKSSLWSLLCHRTWLHSSCEQVQAWCCCGVVQQVAIIWCHFYKSQHCQHYI